MRSSRTRPLQLLRRAPSPLPLLLMACALCLLRGAAGGAGGPGAGSAARCDGGSGGARAPLFCVGTNLWVHADRLWALVEAPRGGASAEAAWNSNDARKLTKTLAAVGLPVRDAAAHVANVLLPAERHASAAAAEGEATQAGALGAAAAGSGEAGAVAAVPWRQELAVAARTGSFAGVTLAIELPYPAFPSNLAHWAEVLFPVYSALRSPAWRRYPVARVLLVGIKRAQWLDWYEQSLRLALGTLGAEGGADAPLLFWDEVLPLGQQGSWVRFEYLLAARDVRDAATGARGFLSAADARSFRDDAYRASGLQPYARAEPAILYLGPDNSTRVTNELEVLALLESYNRTVYKMDMLASMTFDLVVRTTAAVGVLVSVTGAALTNAVLLPPGGAVYELLPYRWGWKGIDRMHWNLTRNSADIHHFAWRATNGSEVRFDHPRTMEKYSGWMPSECTTRECIGAHARTRFRVDLGELKALLDQTLPRIESGSQVWEHPWPPIDSPEEARLLERERDEV